MGISAFFSGVAGLVLTPDEQAFFADASPWGIILFARNIADPNQVRTLVDDFRRAVGREDAPVLIDQEGGRVRRLRPPYWGEMPAAGMIGALYDTDPDAGKRAAWLSGRLIGEDLYQLGITVDCFPMADLRFAGAHDIVGDRAYGDNADQVTQLACAAAAGLGAAGIAPVIKHIPGHGRAMVDSHLSLPVVDADYDALAATDFMPFAHLNRLPMAMTAHVVYSALDADNPATISARVINDIIRGEIGFDGLLMSDDLSMKALSGDMTDRTRGVFSAGCDMALHCNGDMAEMVAVASCSPTLSGAALQRAQKALAWPERVSGDIKLLHAEFTALMGVLPSVPMA